VAKAVAGGMAVKPVAPAAMVATEAMPVMVAAPAAPAVLVAVATGTVAVAICRHSMMCTSNHKSVPGSRTRSMWSRICDNQIDSSSHPSTGDRAACHDS
jgi:hypothetical protein